MILLLVLFINKNISAQQSYEALQGFYDMSSFEMAAGLYLLEDHTFYYYASFGNVDLKIYGDYKIINDRELNFVPHKYLMQEFFVFGTHTHISTDSLRIKYIQPIDENFNNLTAKRV